MIAQPSSEPKQEQISEEPEQIQEGEQIFTIVEVMPVFPGTPDALANYIKDHLIYPQIARDNDIQGTVYIQFVINSQGKIVNPKIAKGIDKYLDAEALRVVTNMPDWKLGMQNGKPVKVQFTVPHTV